MINEADLLNEIYDLKEERKEIRKFLLRITDPFDRRTWGLEDRLKTVIKRIDRNRAQLWKNVGSRNTFAPMYSSNLCRTGRVKPRRGR